MRTPVLQYKTQLGFFVRIPYPVTYHLEHLQLSVLKERYLNAKTPPDLGRPLGVFDEGRGGVIDGLLETFQTLRNGADAVRVVVVGS